MRQEIKYLTLSDIHLGNQRNKTTEIIKNLDYFFDDYRSSSQFTDLDIIFIAGDLFDRLLDFSSTEIPIISMWLSRLMRFCARFNIKLRLLEGTPSHDWKQSKVAVTIASILKEQVNFKYVETLHIEYMEDLDIHVLYVPDEWTANSDLTFKQIEDLMTSLHITQVDIAIMHGLFQYQLQNVPGNIQKHEENKYLSIVKYFINIGHIHTYSNYQRIIAQGSFDRMTHGEEEPKGAVVCYISPDNRNHFTFIENKKARIFKTINLRSKDLDKSLEQIDKVLNKIPHNSYVRIKANKDHPLYVAFDDLKMKYPFYYFTKTNLEDDSVTYTLVDNTVQLSDSYTPITLTEDNLITLLLEEIKSKYPLQEKELSLLTDILNKTK
jgi:DNA repair exonuclease SbcCD nuclease subunit